MVYEKFTIVHNIQDSRGYSAKAAAFAEFIRKYPDFEAGQVSYTYYTFSDFAESFGEDSLQLLVKTHYPESDGVYYFCGEEFSDLESLIQVLSNYKLVSGIRVKT